MRKCKQKGRHCHEVLVATLAMAREQHPRRRPRLVDARPAAIARNCRRAGRHYYPRQYTANVAARESLFRRPCRRQICRRLWRLALRRVQREASQHGDIAFVNASDCSPWHAGHKIHAWYRWALRSLPARWYGKARGDSIVSIEPLLMELSMLPDTVHLFGVNLQWIAHCRQQATTLTWSKPLAAQTCAQGCWLGRVASSLKRATRRPPRCEKAFDGRPVTPGSTLCHMLPYAPFAPGPLEVRSSQLAQLVASCSYADAYFHSLVTRGALINDECASTDGSQGHAIGECAAEAWGHLVVADGDMWRQSYANSGLFAHLRRAANTSATDGRGIVHPMYGGGGGSRLLCRLFIRSKAIVIRRRGVHCGRCLIVWLRMGGRSTRGSAIQMLCASRWVHWTVKAEVLPRTPRRSRGVEVSELQ